MENTGSVLPFEELTEEQQLERCYMEICKGDADAILFCSAWMTYCHQIDDIIDTMEDGRPTMEPQEILSTFANAALIYNNPFYIKNQKMLFPVALLITNAYCDVVNYEKSPKKHLRAIADVIRCNGNEMFFMVAMLCGGYNHMRKYSNIIREKSWMLQHDENGNP